MLVDVTVLRFAPYSSVRGRHFSGYPPWSLPVCHCPCSKNAITNESNTSDSMSARPRIIGV
jgi:hypothetical protein